MGSRSDRYDGAIRAFEQQFPGITVSLTGGFNVLNAGIEEQVRTKKVNTDLVILQTIQDFLAEQAPTAAALQARWLRQGRHPIKRQGRRMDRGE